MSPAILPIDLGRVAVEMGEGGAMRLFTVGAVVLACLTMFHASGPAAAAEAIRVMSFNIRYGTADDGVTN